MDRFGESGNPPISPKGKRDSLQSSSPPVLKKNQLPDEEQQKAQLVDEWKQSSILAEDPSGIGIFGRLFHSLITHYKSLLNDDFLTRRMTESQKAAFKEQYHVLRLWGDDFGVLQGEMDRKLEQSRDIKVLTLSLLSSLARSLSQGIPDPPLASGDVRYVEEVLREARSIIREQDSEGPEESDSDGSEDEFAADNFDEVLMDLEAYTQGLLDLISPLEWPAKDLASLGEEPPVLENLGHSPHHYFSDIMREKFPKADSDLIEQLGRSNWERYKRLALERERNEQNVDSAPIDFTCGFSTFHDSALGSSVPATTSYAQSVASMFSSNTGSSSARLPPLSDNAKEGKPFPCDACGRRIVVKTNRQWKKHLYQDLQPYRCFYENCALNNSAFATQQLWADHVHLDHWLRKSIDNGCPLCFEKSESGQRALSRHIARHLEDVSLGALPCSLGPDETDGEDDGVSYSPTSSSAAQVPLLHPDELRKEDAENQTKPTEAKLTWINTPGEDYKAGEGERNVRYRKEEREHHRKQSDEVGGSCLLCTRARKSCDPKNTCSNCESKHRDCIRPGKLQPPTLGSARLKPRGRSSLRSMMANDDPSPVAPSHAAFQDGDGGMIERINPPSPVPISPQQRTSSSSSRHNLEFSHHSNKSSRPNPYPLRKRGDHKRLSETETNHGRHANDWLFGGFSVRESVGKLWIDDEEEEK